ncbi:hypothetical protein BDN67DRAFT_62552 [Paxillus ammoniavirescens]|nr:hypothetical protein BDN67DRAFT_62552 [Paxillus ammoniavirescens]
MFAKLTALVLALPLVSALTINTPIGATTGGMVTLTWTATTTDPTSFTFELTNTIFHNTFAIANTVTTSQGSITIQLPQVPVGDGYTLEAVANKYVFLQIHHSEPNNRCCSRFLFATFVATSTKSTLRAGTLLLVPRLPPRPPRPPLLRRRLVPLLAPVPRPPCQPLRPLPCLAQHLLQARRHLSHPRASAMALSRLSSSAWVSALLLLSSCRQWPGL